MAECPIHHIEKLVQTGSTMVGITDEDGNVIGEEPKDVEFEYCPECEYEQEQKERSFIVENIPTYDELDFMEEGPEASQEIEKRITNYETTHADFKPKKWNLIGDIMLYLENTDADTNPRKSMALYMISSVLKNCHSANSKGSIRPNLGFWWGESSGVGKTPVNVAGVDAFMPTVFSGYLRYETGTSKGIRKSISKLFKSDDKNLIPILFTWDEAQDILSMLKQDALADIYSFFNQLLDNRIQRYTTVARGDEKYPPLYTTIWISGVPEIFEKSDKNFWFDGAGTRFLFVKSRNTTLKPIKRESESNLDKDSIIEKLTELQGIKYVKYTDAYLEEYNKYRMEILQKITEVQMDIMASQSIDNFPILSKTKYPVLIWKLAIIHSASRGNFDGELLVMDVEDLEEAKKDLEEYNANMIDQFNYWLSASNEKEKIVTIEKMITKFKKHTETIKRNEKNRWTLTLIENTKEDSEIRFHANRDTSGNWIDLQLLLRYAKLDTKVANSVLQSLEEQGYIAKKKASYQKDNKGSYDYVGTFIGWRKLDQ